MAHCQAMALAWAYFINSDVSSFCATAGDVVRCVCSFRCIRYHGIAGDPTVIAFCHIRWIIGIRNRTGAMVIPNQHSEVTQPAGTAVRPVEDLDGLDLSR